MLNKRDAVLKAVWEGQDQAYHLMSEYDSLPHHYGENILYQAEGDIIDLIAVYPGITVTELAAILKKTTSACSQIVRKLRAKGWVLQSRNEENNRQFNLTLTESGRQVHADHVAFNLDCQEITFKMLEGFSVEELEIHRRIQEKLNLAYEGDIKRSREKFR